MKPQSDEFKNRVEDLVEKFNKIFEEGEDVKGVEKIKDSDEFMLGSESSENLRGNYKTFEKLVKNDIYNSREKFKQYQKGESVSLLQVSPLIGLEERKILKEISDKEKSIDIIYAINNYNNRIERFC